MIRSIKLFSCLMTAVIAIIASGCCGPAGCGIGCGNYSCSDCDGGFRQPVYGGGPIAAARNLRRNAICGSGCGEAYIGEWTSTPPDCTEPCSGPAFVGGAVKARPFCRPRPCLGCGNLLRAIYGKRTCSGDESSQACPGEGDFCSSCSSGSCSSGSCSSGSCSSAGYVDDYSVIETEVVAPGPVSGGCGCATCRGPASPMATRLAAMGRHPTGDSIAARARRTTERAQQIRRR